MRDMTATTILVSFTLLMVGCESSVSGTASDRESKPPEVAEGSMPPAVESGGGRANAGGDKVSVSIEERASEERINLIIDGVIEERSVSSDPTPALFEISVYQIDASGTPVLAGSGKTSSSDFSVRVAGWPKGVGGVVVATAGGQTIGSALVPTGDAFRPEAAPGMSLNATDKWRRVKTMISPESTAGLFVMSAAMPKTSLFLIDQNMIDTLTTAITNAAAKTGIEAKSLTMAALFGQIEAILAAVKAVMAPAGTDSVDPNPELLSIAIPPEAAKAAGLSPEASDFQIETRAPYVVARGQVVTLGGKNLGTNLQIRLAAGDRRVLSSRSDSPSAVYFEAPSDQIGRTSLVATRGGRSVQLEIFVTPNKDLPVITLPESEVCAPKRYVNGDGNEKVGTKICEAPAACAADGEVNCLAVANFPAVDKLGVLQPNVAQVRSTLTIAGVSGTLGNCASAGSQSCFATGSYKAAVDCTPNGSNCYLPAYVATTQPLKAVSFDAIDASKMLTTLTLSGVVGTVDLTNLIASNVKSGVNIAGVTGQYPSASYRLPGASATSDLPDLDASLATGPYEYWDSTGARRTGSVDDGGTVTPSTSDQTVAGAGKVYRQVVVAGDPDLVASNLVSPAVVFGVVGAIELPSPWDLRAGKSVGSINGSLKTNCRNAVTPSIFNYDGAVGSITNGDHRDTAAPVADWWDTVDNWSGLGTGKPTGWTAANSCGAEMWADVTTGGCDATKCIMVDQGSGLWWSKEPTGSPGTWATAVQTCDGLTLDGYSDWRLPTQLELMQAHVHNISTAESANFIPSTGSHFWSATSYSYMNFQEYAWSVNLRGGETSRQVWTGSAWSSKATTGLIRFTCVR